MQVYNPLHGVKLHIHWQIEFGPEISKMCKLSLNCVTELFWRSWINLATISYSSRFGLNGKLSLLLFAEEGKGKGRKDRVGIRMMNRDKVEWSGMEWNFAVRFRTCHCWIYCKPSKENNFGSHVVLWFFKPESHLSCNVQSGPDAGRNGKPEILYLVFAEKQHLAVFMFV